MTGMVGVDAKVYVIQDRKRTEVTEEVKTVLDCLQGSLDWGSGFLCAEDIEAWGKIAGALGMNVKGLQGEIDELRNLERKRAFHKIEHPPVVYQARTKTGKVLVELTSPAPDQGVSWYPPAGTEKPVYWWRNLGSGWENLGEYPV